MAFNNWPWVDLQNLNLDWILRKTKEAVEAVPAAVEAAEAANTAAEQAISAAEDAEDRVDNALEALGEVESLFAIYIRSDGYAYSYKTGEAVNANSIRNMIIQDKMLPFIIDIGDNPNNPLGYYVYTLAGLELVPNSPQTLYIRFAKYSGQGIESIIMIYNDGHVVRTTASIDIVDDFIVSFEADAYDYGQFTNMTCDKTYAEILEAYLNGKHICCEVVGPTGDLMFASDTIRHFNAGEDVGETVKAFQFFLAIIGPVNGVTKYQYCFINSSGTVNMIQTTISSGGGGDSLPTVTSSDYGKLLGVDANGEWSTTANKQQRISITETANLTTITISEIGGSVSAYTLSPYTSVQYVAQTLTDSQKAQARINIGASAEAIRETVSGATATLDAEVDTLYLCGTMTALTIDTFPPTGIFSVVFTSGSTATTLTVPNTLIMPNGFTVEANKRYEINILDGYAVVAEWGVNP